MTTPVQAAVAHLKAQDPLLATVIAQHPLPSFEPHKQYYQELVETIVSQQLSVKAAATIFSRFLKLFPNDAFPSPEAILAVDVETLRSVGLSRQKANYIQDLAMKVIDGSVVFNHLDALTNDEVITELTQIKGVGVWTVHMFLMFCMGRLNVLPIGDLGILNGAQRLYDLPSKPTAQELIELADSHGWAPYESVASWYIWKSLDNEPKL